MVSLQSLLSTAGLQSPMRDRLPPVTFPFLFSSPAWKPVGGAPFFRHHSLSKQLAGLFRAALKTVFLVTHSSVQTPPYLANLIFPGHGLPTPCALLPQRLSPDRFLRAPYDPEHQCLLSGVLSAPQRAPIPSRFPRQLCRHPSSPTTWCGWSLLPTGHPSSPPAPKHGASLARLGSCLTSSAGSIWRRSWFPHPRLQLMVLWLNSGQRLLPVPRHQQRRTLGEGRGWP